MVCETYFAYEWTLAGFARVRKEREMMVTTTGSQQADLDFRDSMGEIVSNPSRLATLSPALQDYVLYAYDSMSWWIGKGGAGVVPWPESKVPSRTQIILVWAGLEGSTVSLRQASVAIEFHDACYAPYGVEGLAGLKLPNCGVIRRGTIPPLDVRSVISSEMKVWDEVKISRWPSPELFNADHEGDDVDFSIENLVASIRSSYRILVWGRRSRADLGDPILYMVLDEGGVWVEQGLVGFDLLSLALVGAVYAGIPT